MASLTLNDIYATVEQLPVVSIGKRFSYMKEQANRQTTQKPNRPQHNLGKITKTFQQDGRWIEKKTKTAILICVCGTRYIKTRARQVTCLRCMFSPIA